MSARISNFRRDSLRPAHFLADINDGLAEYEAFVSVGARQVFSSESASGLVVIHVVGRNGVVHMIVAEEEVQTVKTALGNPSVVAASRGAELGWDGE